MCKWFKNKKAEENFLLVNTSDGCADLNKTIQEKWHLVSWMTSKTNCNNTLCHLRKLDESKSNILAILIMSLALEGCVMLGIILNRFVVVAIVMSLLLGIGAAVAYPSDNRTVWNLQWQRFVYFGLHFICSTAGWVALGLLLKVYTSFNVFPEILCAKAQISDVLMIVAKEPTFFIFLVILAVFGITDQLAAFVYFSAKIPEKLISKFK